MPQNDLYLEILGTSFRITADEEASYLEELLAAYNEKVRELQESTGLRDPLKIAILTGYSLCDELYKARRNTGTAAAETEETLSRTLNFITTRLDQALENNKPPDPQVLYRMTNPVQHYAWGSSHWIPHLLHTENPGEEPWAELWMGAHPASPSTVQVRGGGIGLGQLIAEDPRRYLGAEGAANFGGLPFLFKLLAAARPLSIQAHPGKEQARQGWQRENDRGIPLDAPERNYRDDNHKPEILCALSPFTALCGFRLPRDIYGLLSAYLANAPRSLQSGLAPLWAALEGGNEGGPLRGFFKRLYAIPGELRMELTAYALSAQDPGSPEADPGIWPLIRRFAGYYPGDPGILAPLYLNLLRLAPGQAIYLPAGILHAYVEGFGVELMANSDNVLRGGLTSKHIDVDELTRVLYFHPFMPELISPRLAAPGAAGKPDPAEPSPAAGFFSYPSPCREFSLSIIHNLEGPLPISAPAVIVVIRGRLTISAGKAAAAPSEAAAGGALPASWELGPGQSAFIPPSAVPPDLSGIYTLYAASIPPPAPRTAAEPG
jgi:mannose-6-phosphate isomerase